MKHVTDVFGMSNVILKDSYVDRGSLDKEFAKLLSRKTHIAIKGPSKCGKSWLRQKALDNGIIVQCRLGTTIEDIYRSALSALNISLVIEETVKGNIKGRVESSAEIGINLIAKASAKASLESNLESTQTRERIGKDINDLSFIASIIVLSGRRLVIEDAHYLSAITREQLAFDLKALWDFGCFVVIVGIWGQSNQFIHLNSDLSGRIEELSIEWVPDDLRRILINGGNALGITLSSEIQRNLIMNSFGSAGLIQRLILKFLDECNIEYEQNPNRHLIENDKLESASMAIADQLNGVYIKFAERVAGGIRNRSDSTGIYAHSLAAIMDSNDFKMMNGLSVDEIFNIAHARQPRILKQNLKTILAKLDSLQIDSEGRGLVVTYIQDEEKVINVDRQLLFYRKYITINWPWETLIKEAEQSSTSSNSQINLDID